MRAPVPWCQIWKGREADRFKDWGRPGSEGKGRESVLARAPGMRSGIHRECETRTRAEQVPRGQKPRVPSGTQES